MHFVFKTGKKIIVKLGIQEFIRVFITSFLLVFIYSFSLSQKPDTICSNADVFCDSSSMVGPWTLPDLVLSSPPGSICNIGVNTGKFNNSLFFKFVPSSSTVEIEVIVNSLTRRTPISKMGYQYGIIEACVFGDSIKYVVCDGDSLQTNIVIQANSFKPGRTYILFIDGFEASKMTFNLRVIKGIGDLKVDNVEYFNVEGEGEYFANDTVSVCQNGQYKIAVEGVNNAASYVWRVNGIIDNSDTSLIYRFQDKGVVYKIEALGYTDCGNSPFGALYFKVDTIPDEILNDTIICANDLSAGVNPSGWLGGDIKKEGISRFKVVYPSGCFHWQQIRVIKKIEPIVSIDTVLCNVGSIVFAGETFSKDTTVQVIYQTMIGCDSIVNYRFYFMRFDGNVTQLECNNGTSYMIRIIPVNFNAEDYDSIKVTWMRNNILYKETNTFELFPLSLSGTYSAIVTVYKNNRFCSFNLNDVNITEIPDAAFTINNDLICQTDSIELTLNNFSNLVSYNISSLNSAVQVLGNGKYKLKWNVPGIYGVTVETDFNGCKTEYSSQVSVKKELNIPAVSCVKSTNTSIEFDWVESDSDCLAEYEVWINGVLLKKVNSGPEMISGLNYGESVNITIKSISDCVCPDKIDSTVCKALPCPNLNVSITGVPRQICADLLPDFYQLNFESGTQGTPLWSGDAVEADGKISKSKLKLGENFIFLQLKVDECTYSFDTSIMVLPEVLFDYNTTELSCFDSEDGSLTVIPVQGNPDYSLTLNGKAYTDMNISNLASGKYDLELKDSNGCLAHASFTLIKPEKLFAQISGEDRVNFNQPYTYFVESDFTEVDSIIWYINDSIICANMFCDSVKIIPADDYRLCVELIYGNECIVDDCIDVRVNRDFDIYVPNIFTPNFDGINDIFRIKSTNGVEINVKTMQIFDRWGEMLYKKDDFIYGNGDDYVGWDGRFHEKLSLPGVYVYYIEILKENGEITRLAGDITLLR